MNNIYKKEPVTHQAETGKERQNIANIGHIWNDGGEIQQWL